MTQNSLPKRKQKKTRIVKLKSKIVRRYLIAGLLFWLPMWATLGVIMYLVEAMDKTVSYIPDQYQPQHILGFHIPGIGVVLCFLTLFFTGLFVTNIVGERLVKWGESFLNKIPLVRSIYQATKQVTETIFSSNSEAFRKVLLIEYPRKGLWSIAFQTASTSKVIDSKMTTDSLTVFVPTTPNPTSGFLLLVSREEVIELDMTIDEALKMVISLGVMQPNGDSHPHLKAPTSKTT